MEEVTIEKTYGEIGQSPDRKMQRRSENLDCPSREECYAKGVVSIAKGCMKGLNGNCEPRRKEDKEERK
jgi:hypothetical protein